jgi:hypothetical protein
LALDLLKVFMFPITTHFVTFLTFPTLALNLLKVSMFPITTHFVTFLTFPTLALNLLKALVLNLLLAVMFLDLFLMVTLIGGQAISFWGSAHSEHSSHHRC